MFSDAREKNESLLIIIDVLIQFLLMRTHKLYVIHLTNDIVHLISVSHLFLRTFFILSSRSNRLYLIIFLFIIINMIYFAN